MAHGAESALANPALISSVKGTEVSFGGTIFMPDVQTSVGEGYKDSDADLSVIPEVAVAQKVSDNFTWGIGMFGTAGMGVDHRDEAGGAFNNYKMVTNLQLMQFAVPLAYTTDGLSIGFAPVVQYGSLDINYLTPALAQSTTQGVAQDFGMGYNLGIAYEMSGLTVGASYKSAIDMLYKGQLSKATVQFGMNGGAGLADNLEQPAEIGVGLSYTTDGHTLAFDYKKIKWESAKGYKDFGWEDQNVYIVGYQYAQDNWALRAGYNYAKSPITEQVGTDAAQKNLFNLLGFPGIVEKHYTLGGSYAFTKMTSLDLAYVYADENTETFAATGMTANNAVSTKHSQDAVSFQLNFNF